MQIIRPVTNFEVAVSHLVIFQSDFIAAQLPLGNSPPENDRCIQREILKPYIPVTGDNTNANFDYNAQGVCGSRSDRQALWYEVLGRGAMVKVSVCTNNDIITDFGVLLECNTQLCEGAPPQTFEPANCDLGESIDFSWMAENNMKYYVHVRSDIVDGVGSNFTIVYEDESLDGPLKTESPTESPGEENIRIPAKSSSSGHFLTNVSALTAVLAVITVL